MSAVEDPAAEIVLAWLLREGPPADVRRALVVDDDSGRLGPALRRAGVEVLSWRRRALAGKATVTPPRGEVDLALLRLPRDWPSFALQVHLAASRLRPGGRLWVFGGNEEGIKSAPRRLLEQHPGLAAETLWIKQRARIVEALRPEGWQPMGELAAWRQTVRLDLPEVGPVELLSYPGLFAQGRLDEASALLLRALRLPPPGARVLDLGCGPGTLSLALARRQPGLRLHLADVDALALAAAAENLPGATYLEGDGWAAVELGARFDLILSNPPLHRGHGQDLRVLHELVDQAPERLLPGGRLCLVSWKATGVVERMRRRLVRVEVLAEQGGTVVVEGARAG